MCSRRKYRSFCKKCNNHYKKALLHKKIYENREKHRQIAQKKVYYENKEPSNTLDYERIMLWITM